ncbi:hypothetical protein ABFZ85_06500 [Hyphococcus formosus]
MFSKKKMVGGIYKNVTDWGAVAGTVIFVLFVLALLGNLGG